MAGRSVSGTTNGPAFIGYFGIQILLSDYGRALEREDTPGRAATTPLDQ
jgi:hypothetical protein